MAEVVPMNAEHLEWLKKDNRRLLYAFIRADDVERTIKFYTECLGMKLLSERHIPSFNGCRGLCFPWKRGNPEENNSSVSLGYGPEKSHFVLKSTEDRGVDSLDIGSGFGHFSIETQDVYKMVEDIKAKGGTVTREPGPEKGETTVFAFVKDPDGYVFELIQRGPNPEPICQVMLRVVDLERSIKFYEKALGMKLLKKIDNPPKKCTLAMMGYADDYEKETTILALTNNYDVTEYTKGNAYGHIAISTDDVSKSTEVVELAIEEYGGKITSQPGPRKVKTKMTSFLDPDGWKIILVDNEDFMKELQ